jgi:hypothetical protein
MVHTTPVLARYVSSLYSWTKCLPIMSARHITVERFSIKFDSGSLHTEQVSQLILARLFRHRQTEIWYLNYHRRAYILYLCMVLHGLVKTLHVNRLSILIVNRFTLLYSFSCMRSLLLLILFIWLEDITSNTWLLVACNFLSVAQFIFG